MTTTNQIYIFYLIIIVGLSMLAYKFTNGENKMNNSMYAAVAGAIISIFLWSNYGYKMVEEEL